MGGPGGEEGGDLLKFGRDARFGPAEMDGPNKAWRCVLLIRARKQNRVLMKRRGYKSQARRIVQTQKLYDVCDGACECSSRKMQKRPWAVGCLGSGGLREEEGAVRQSAQISVLVIGIRPLTWLLNKSGEESTF